MRTVIPASMCAAMLAALPGIARSEDASAPAEAQWGSPIPDEPAASEQPPAPERQTQSPASTANTAVPPGQWVYTEQYGWVWMPYSSAYTYASQYVAEPYMYVYGPAFGWAWVGAPWVWGYGAGVYFGVHGGFGYGWRHPGYAWWGGGHPRWYGSGRGFGPRLWGGTAPAPPHHGFVGGPHGFVGSPRGFAGGPRAGSGGTHGGFGGHRGGRH